QGQLPVSGCIPGRLQDGFLLIDPYTAEILNATGHKSIPQLHWAKVRLYIPYRQQVKIKDRELFKEPDGKKIVCQDKLPYQSNKFVMIFRYSNMWDKGVNKSLEKAVLSYSMWEGYLKDDSTKRVRDWLKNNNIPRKIIHTSGHASVVDLKKFAEALNPKRLVPIHTFEPEKYSEHFNNVEYQQDGQWWDV
ncbi:MAG: MBL fold metallo-hydrolase, partial [Gammaproteobacteria bacterium]|nr:MBL fold metallo-hydrolase [Gammaproteobacteria bacterium]